MSAKLLMFVFSLGLITQVYAATLTPEQIAKVKTDYENSVLSGSFSDQSEIDGTDLKAAALKEFNRLSKVKNCKSFGYCPHAYAIDAGGLKTFAVDLEDDGGMYLSIYTEEGLLIASATQSESGDLTW